MAFSNKRSLLIDKKGKSLLDEILPLMKKDQLLSNNKLKRRKR